MIITLVLRIIKPIAVYTLCLVYSSIVGLTLTIKYLFNSRNEVWKAKDHSIPPKCLNDPKYGTHKYMHVNVSKIKNSI